MPALPLPQGLAAVAAGPAAGCAGQLEGQGEGKVFANTATPWLFPQSYFISPPKNPNFVLPGGSCALHFYELLVERPNVGRQGLVFPRGLTQSQPAACGEFTP